MKNDTRDSFGKRLRELRKKEGVASPEVLAKRMRGAVSVSGILKRERGEIKIDREYVEAFAAALKLDRQTRIELESLLEVFEYQFNPWKLNENGLGQIQFDYWKRIRFSRSYRQFETLYVSSLLQTAEYAYEAIRTFDVSHDVANDAARSRFHMCSSFLSEIARGSDETQELPEISIIQDEESLYRIVGSRRVMSAQMDYLLQVTEQKGLQLKILPRLQRQTVPLGYSINIFGEYLATTETACGHLFVTDPETLRVLGRWFTTIEEAAVSGSKARRLIENAKRAYSSQE